MKVPVEAETTNHSETRPVTMSFSLYDRSNRSSKAQGRTWALSRERPDCPFRTSEASKREQFLQLEEPLFCGFFWKKGDRENQSFSKISKYAGQKKTSQELRHSTLPPERVSSSQKGGHSRLFFQGHFSWKESLQGPFPWRVENQISP